MILGTQWYILFNVIAGASAMPTELRYAAANFGVRGWLWWRKVALPGVLPYYVTGAITASGGSWNAAIVAELASWRDVAGQGARLGAYIAEATTAGDFHRIILGIATMSLFVVAINRVFWRPLYYFAERKYPAELSSAGETMNTAPELMTAPAAVGAERLQGVSQARRRRAAGARRRQPDARWRGRSSACSAARARASRRCCG